MSTVLSIKNLSFGYDSTEVLSGVSFAIDKGDYVALAGPNGAGKTTLVRVILGLEGKHKGRVEIFGKDLEAFSDWDRIGYLPQQVNVFNPLFPATVKEVVGLGLLSHKSFPKKFERSDEATILRTLDLMDIVRLKDKLIGALSGGQQQRVFLARALAQEAELVLLDEPLTGLDLPSQEAIFQLLDELRTLGVPALIATHDLNLASERFDRVLLLNHRLVAHGSPSEVLTQPHLIQAYGGHVHLLPGAGGLVVLTDTCCDGGEEGP